MKRSQKQNQVRQRKSKNDNHLAFISGCAAGVSQVLVGQPFDLVKVRLQVSNGIYKNSSDVIKQTIKKEGLLAFYKGTSAPLFGTGLTVSLQFGSYSFFQKLFNNDNSIFYTSLCGALAGIVQCIVMNPVENLRIRAQIQKKQKIKTPYQLTIDIYKQHGLKGIYKGMSQTLLREIIGNSVYFSNYELMIKWYIMTYEIERQKMPVMAPFMAGSIAGLNSWIASYPIDIVKTILQSQCFLKPEYKNSLQIYRSILANDGFQGFFRGFTPCGLRSIPVNGTGFFVYEHTHNYLKKITNNI